MRIPAMLAVAMTISSPVVSAAPGASVPGQGEAVPAVMDQFVREQMAAVGVPGAAFAVVGPEGVEHAATFGVDGWGHPVTGATPFLWGSIAKPVTATLTLSLVRSGELHLEDRIIDVLPEFSLRDHGTSHAVTVEQLLQHTSGIPEAMELTDRFESGRGPQQVLGELADLEPVGRPGERHQYSSVNYLVLSAVIERLTGRPFADVLGERVLEPLRMSGAITTEQQSRRLPPGHRYVLGRPVATDSPFDPAGVGYGYLGGSLTDLAAFARAQLGADPDVLTGDELTRMHTNGVTTGAGASYGLGWRRTSLAGVGIDSAAEMIWHGGAAPGYQADILLLPGSDRAVVLLQNSYGPFQEDALLATAFGLVALLENEQPPVSATNWLYRGLVSGMALLLLGLLGAAGHAVVRWRRFRSGALPTSPRRIVAVLFGWLFGAAAIAALVGLYLPSSYGTSVARMGIWAPDVGRLIGGVLVCTAGLAVLRIGVATVGLRRAE